MSPPRVPSQQGRVLAGLGLLLAAIGTAVVLTALTATGGPVNDTRPAQAASITYTLEGQIFGNGYTTGNLCATTGSGDCYHDGDQVPHRLTITGLTPATTYTLLQIQLDFLDSDGHTGYANFNSLVCTSGCSGAAVLGAGAQSVSGPHTVLTYPVTFTTGASATTVQLDWNAQLGLDAHLWSGSSLHVRLVRGVEGESIGNKEVPLPVKQLVVPTSTPTATATSTPTSTPTETATPTATATGVATGTATATSTATSTSTAPPTATGTPPPTATGTPPPTSAATTAPTSTAAVVETVLVAVETPAPTFTPTASPTPTLVAEVAGVAVTPAPVQEVQALARAGSGGEAASPDIWALALGGALIALGGGLLLAARRQTLRAG